MVNISKMVKIPSYSLKLAVDVAILYCSMPVKVDGTKLVRVRRSRKIGASSTSTAS